ncbi:MAG TPA: hypothetical protein VK859_06370 [bacterium]|jgi:hypothetical protein|nr:hypothetical protein [bacterium]
MALFNPLLSLFGKKSSYTSEYKRFEKAMEANPHDHGLKAQFIKFCLLNRFTKHEVIEEHITEALRLFEAIENGESFDLQCHYLVGKYYQEAKDNRKAYQVYLNAIKRFNQYVVKNPDLKSENVELAYSVALNLMTLQSSPFDPELEKCFKNIRKSYPLHVKRIEFENEMAKPAPDKVRIHQLTEEIRALKAEEEKETLAAAKEREATAAVKDAASKPPEKEDIFTRLFRVPSPFSKEWVDQAPKITPEEKKDFLKIAPEFNDPGSSFMIFRNNDWEGPYTLAQLRPMGHLDPSVWVCRVGSQLVSQAYEVPDLHPLIQQQVK